MFNKLFRNLSSSQLLNSCISSKANCETDSDDLLTMLCVASDKLNNSKPSDETKFITISAINDDLILNVEYANDD